MLITWLSIVKHPGVVSAADGGARLRDHHGFVERLFFVTGGDILSCWFFMVHESERGLIY